MVLGNTCGNLCNKPIVLFTLVKIVLLWMLKENFESKCRPRHFWESALLTGLLLRNILHSNIPPRGVLQKSRLNWLKLRQSC